MEIVKLIGVLIVIAGFILKLDTLAVVVTAGLATGLVAGVVYALLFDRILKRRFGDKRRKRRQTNMTWTLSTAVAEFFYCIIGLIFIGTGFKGSDL